MSMFPHTITLYAVEIRSDTSTARDTVANNITILRGVLLDASRAVNRHKSGLEGANTVALYIPFDVEAVDGVTGGAKEYVAPLRFWRYDKSTHCRWTMSVGGTKACGTNGYCFFVKGEAVHPRLAEDAIRMMYDDVYRIKSIAEKDFGGLPHWEIGAV